MRRYCPLQSPKMRGEVALNAAKSAHVPGRQTEEKETPSPSPSSWTATTELSHRRKQTSIRRKTGRPPGGAGGFRSLPGQEGKWTTPKKIGSGTVGLVRGALNALKRKRLSSPAGLGHTVGTIKRGSMFF